MKRLNLLALMVFLFLSLTFLSINSVGTQETYHSQDEYVPNEVLVKFQKDINRNFVQQAIELVQGKVITYLGEEISPIHWDPDISSLRSFLEVPDLLHIRVPKVIGTEQAIYILNLDPNVEYAQKNLIYSADTIPDDPHFSKLWGMRNTGQTGGKSDADIDADLAWNIFTGSSDIVVAVIDTGIDYDHDDLAANIWTNPGESGGGKETNGIDDDNNGYIDDWRGWNFVNNNNNPMDDNSYQYTYHGTHVAGTIGAVGDNDTGVVGVNWDVKLMAAKFLNWEGEGTTANAIKAIDYSTNNGAHLSNNSWGGGGDDQALYNAIIRARNAGKLFIASAGNDSEDTDTNPHYPSSYNLGNIISVLSTDHNDNKSGFSNYGANSVDIGGPGGTGDESAKDIYSTQRYDDYQYLYGTSMATPHVAAVAALAWGKLPYPPFTYVQLKGRILSKIDSLCSLNGKCVSGGRANAYKVIYDSSSPTSPSNLGATPTGWDLIRVSWSDNSNNEIGFEIQRKKEGESNFSYYASASGFYYDDYNATTGTTCYYKIRAYNMAGFTSFIGPVNAQVPDAIPVAPSNLDGDFSYGLGAVVLTWSDNSNNEQEFSIERKSEYDPWWEEIDRVGSNTTSYEDYSVDGDTFYWYRVRAYNPNGYSSYSNEKSVYVPWY